MNICKNVNVDIKLQEKEKRFLAHLSQRIKWAFLIKICPLSFFGVVVNFSHFHLLLQNHWANFNRTWHKASLCKVDSSLFKWRPPLFFPSGDDYKTAKIHWQNLKIFFARTAEPISTKFGTKHPWGKGIKFFEMKNQ